MWSERRHSGTPPPMAEQRVAATAAHGTRWTQTSVHIAIAGEHAPSRCYRCCCSSSLARSARGCGILISRMSRCACGFVQTHAEVFVWVARVHACGFFGTSVRSGAKDRRSRSHAISLSATIASSVMHSCVVVRSTPYE